jgi:hypothetical protein
MKFLKKLLLTTSLLAMLLQLQNDARHIAAYSDTDSAVATHQTKL